MALNPANLPPNFFDEWQRVNILGDPRSFEAWAVDHAIASGDPILTEAINASGSAESRNRMQTGTSTGQGDQVADAAFRDYQISAGAGGDAAKRVSSQVQTSDQAAAFESASERVRSEVGGQTSATRQSTEQATAASRVGQENTSEIAAGTVDTTQSTLAQELSTNLQRGSTTQFQDIVGQETQEQVQTGESVQFQDLVGSEASRSVGQTVDAQTGTVTNTGGVVDTLGLGNLITGAGERAVDADVSRQSFLTDLVETGGSGFQSGVDQAINRSLSGPGITGAGEGAQARAAGFAADEFSRRNLGSRLSAADLLARPGATTGVVQAGTPLLGFENKQTVDLRNVGEQASAIDSTTGQQVVGSEQFTDRGAGSTFSNQASVGGGTTENQAVAASIIDQLVSGRTDTASAKVGTASSDLQTSSSASDSQRQSQNITNFNDIIEKAKESGTSSATSRQAGVGFGPGANLQKGGTVVCTVLIELGLLNKSLVEHEARFFRKHAHEFKDAIRGYYVWGPILANHILRHPRLGILVLPIVLSALREVFRLRRGRRGNFLQRVSFNALKYFSLAVGNFFTPHEFPEHLQKLIIKQGSILPS